MADYGTVAAVKQKLQPSVDSDWTSDDDARLAALQSAISRLIEDELGRTFGAAVPDTTVTFWAGPSDTLILPVAARSVTSVAVGGTVAGGVVTGGTDYPTSLWTHAIVDQRGLILGLRLLSGGWWGDVTATGQRGTPVVVVGDFADTDDDAAVPDDITEAANHLIAETFKAQNASPAGFIGPDGSTVPIRNPWKDEVVVRAFAHWRVKHLVPGF
jgi:hypothetical protein